MDDVEEDYKIEKMKRFQKSLMSLLLSLLIFKHKPLTKQTY
jgi:hypothetical protein